MSRATEDRRGAIIDRTAAFGRTAIAALGVAVGLQLLFRVPLVTTFRAALIALAAVEVLQFGWRVLSEGSSIVLWTEIVVKLAILAVAYAALSS